MEKNTQPDINDNDAAKDQALDEAQDGVVDPARAAYSRRRLEDTPVEKRDWKEEFFEDEKVQQYWDENIIAPDPSEDQKSEDTDHGL